MTGMRTNVYSQCHNTPLLLLFDYRVCPFMEDPAWKQPLKLLTALKAHKKRSAPRGGRGMWIQPVQSQG